MISRERSRRRERRGVLKAAVLRWDALRDVDEVWRRDHAVVLTAVEANGEAFQFAAETLRTN
eukprot:6460159-Amphidinium_carterae.1